MNLQQALSSVGDVWFFWILSVFLVAYGAYLALRHFNWRSLRRLSTDERGASYVLPYILTFPIYLLLVCIMIQATLILLVKFGTMYAAYGAARSAIVWRSSDPEDDDQSYANARYKANRAAVMAMTPFASSNPEHLDGLFPLFPVTMGLEDLLAAEGIPTLGEILPRERLQSYLDGPAYYEMYKRLAERNVQSSAGQLTSYVISNPSGIAPKEYVLRKYKFAAGATAATFSEDPQPWNSDFTVTVTYRMPMHIPGAGRILGVAGKPFYARDISTSVTLPSETPKSATGTVGVPYTPDLLTRLLSE